MMGTSLQGYVSATYQQLVEILGQPTYSNPSADGKVNTEWELMSEYGPVTIYDWKDYDGGELSRSGVKYQWHVGGKNMQALFYVEGLLGL